MRILFVSPRQCWPPNLGAKLREYYVLRALSRMYDVTYVYFHQPGQPVADEHVFAFCRRVVDVPPPQRYTLRKMAQGFAGREPLPVLNYTSEEMRQTVGRLLDEQHFELMHLDSTQMTAYQPLADSCGVPVAYDWHNIESEVMARFGGQTPSIAQRVYARITAKKLRGLEQRILTGAFGHLVCSERERETLAEWAPAARVAVIENGVDTGYFDARRDDGGERRRIVFVGGLNYHANIDGVTWFVRAVWPAIRWAHPEWTLTLVGSNPVPQIVQLRAVPGVEVTGTVPDTRPYYADALAAVVPLRTGGGTRLKILEAMAAGVPVISTALGAEGLVVTPGVEVRIAESERDWCAHLEALAADPAQWHAEAAAGRELVKSRYDWDAIGEKLCSVYGEWLATQTATMKC